MKKIHLVWMAGCALLIAFESVRADSITYTCPPSTALTAAEVPGKKGVWTYTGNLVGGTTPALTIGQWTTADLPPLAPPLPQEAFSQARFEAQGPKGTPVLNCWYGGIEFGAVSPMAINGQADLPSGKTCTPTGNCRNADPAKCPVTCSD